MSGGCGYEAACRVPRYARGAWLGSSNAISRVWEPCRLKAGLQTTSRATASQLTIIQFLSPRAESNGYNADSDRLNACGTGDVLVWFACGEVCEVGRSWGRDEMTCPLPDRSYCRRYLWVLACIVLACGGMRAASAASDTDAVGSNSGQASMRNAWKRRRRPSKTAPIPPSGDCSRSSPCWRWAGTRRRRIAPMRRCGTPVRIFAFWRWHIGSISRTARPTRPLECSR